MKLHVVWGAALLAVFTASPVFAADSAAGKKVAGATCAVCQGIDGLAKNPEAPHLAGETAAYLVKQLKAFKTGERKHEQMSIIAEGLSEADMANVAAWYSKIKITVEIPQ